MELQMIWMMLLSMLKLDGNIRYYILFILVKLLHFNELYSFSYMSSITIVCIKICSFCIYNICVKAAETWLMNFCG